MTHPQWSYQAVLYEMNVRQLTPQGTLSAAREHLSFLHRMGIVAIWLMPVYPIGEVNRKGTLGSYYSIRDYCAVNPELGTISDLDAFITEAHALGMKVLLDWVANHTARDARWVTEKPVEWYERDAEGEPLVPCDWTDTAKLNYANRDVWQGQIDAMRFWIERHGVDGFRCDMAMLVPMEFWHQTARQLREVKPDLFLLAEAEQPDLFDHGTFDACYGWELHHLMNDVAQQKIRVTAIRDWLCADSYPHTAMRLLFTSNHDENSWSSSEFARMGEARRAMAAFTFVAPQCMPLVYTGQEVGYDHSFAFFDRDPMPDRMANDETEFYSRLIALHRDSPALAAGEHGGVMTRISNNAEDCLLTFVRETGDSRVITAINLSPYAIHADFGTGVYAGTYRDPMTGSTVGLPEHAEWDMAAWEFRIFVR